MTSLTCWVLVFRGLSQPVLRYLESLQSREDPLAVRKAGKKCLGNVTCLHSRDKTQGTAAVYWVLWNV